MSQDDSLVFHMAQFAAEDNAVCDSQENSNNIIYPSEDGNGIRRDVDGNQNIDKGDNRPYPYIPLVFG